jgi:hypothetical protein
MAAFEFQNLKIFLKINLDQFFFFGIHGNNGKECEGCVQLQDYQLLRVKLRGVVYCFEALSQNCGK